ncbi:MAG TPA: helix-turn-helix transcriptional regulator [Alphaproteobacteria bacterium]|nr:helix-turn-helix transcriptional regulator [Alphaproteobacteria bacterium]
MRQVVGRNLRRLRHARGLTQEELAFRAQVDRSYISMLETGTSYHASVAMLAKLAAALGVEPAAFLQPGPGRPGA